MIKLDNVGDFNLSELVVHLRIFKHTDNTINQLLHTDQLNTLNPFCGKAAFSSLQQRVI